MDMDNARARTTDPATSHAAAALVDTNSVADRILSALKAAEDGLTTYELAEATGLARVSVSPSMKPMEIKGFIHRAGTRLTPETNRNALVWYEGRSTKFPFAEDNPEHEDHDPAVAAAWKGVKNKQRAIEVRLFAGMRMVRIEFLDKLGKHVDHVDLSFEEYATVCGFSDMVEEIS